jgi:hypothetical protein
MNGGFDGYISNLWYYNYALGTAAIQNLAEKGPNLKMVGSNGLSDTFFDYLSCFVASLGTSLIICEY